ncbi:hypothetical protein TNCV_3860391 [Trichonephila clavipes]|nr:hypothetical protein TNCV_3860391 [Trichonephila clavipes]
MFSVCSVKLQSPQSKDGHKLLRNVNVLPSSHGLSLNGKESPHFGMVYHQYKMQNIAMAKVTDSRQACHEFQSSAAEDP